MSILKFIDLKGSKRLAIRAKKYTVLYCKAIEEMRKNNYEYQNYEVQIETFKKMLINASCTSNSLLNDLQEAIHNIIALEYSCTNNVAFRLQEVSDNYDTIHNKMIKKVTQTPEYNEYKTIIFSIRRCLIKYCVKDNERAEKIVDWLIDAIYEKVAMEFEATNKMAFECLEFA